MITYRQRQGYSSLDRKKHVASDPRNQDNWTGLKESYRYQNIDENPNEELNISKDYLEARKNLTDALDKE